MAGVQAITAVYNSVAVNTSASTVLQINSNRRYLLLQNTGSVDVYIMFNKAATADTDSILLLADGIGILMQDNVVENGYISAITASGNGKLIVGEF